MFLFSSTGLVDPQIFSILLNAPEHYYFMLIQALTLWKKKTTLLSQIYLCYVFHLTVILFSSLNTEICWPLDITLSLESCPPHTQQLSQGLVRPSKHAPSPVTLVSIPGLARDRHVYCLESTHVKLGFPESDFLCHLSRGPQKSILNLSSLVQSTESSSIWKNCEKWQTAGRELRTRRKQWAVDLTLYWIAFV